MPRQVLRALELRASSSMAGSVDCVPLPDGGKLELWRDIGAQRGINPSPQRARRRALAASSASAWRALARFSKRSISSRRRSADRPAVRLRVRRLGGRGMEDLMRMLPMPVAELLDDWFENDASRARWAALGGARPAAGPRSAGTASACCTCTSAARPASSGRRGRTCVEPLRRFRGRDSEGEVQAHRGACRRESTGVALESDGGELTASAVVAAPIRAAPARVSSSPAGSIPISCARCAMCGCRGVAGTACGVQLERSPGLGRR